MQIIQISRHNELFNKFKKPCSANLFEIRSDQVEMKGSSLAKTDAKRISENNLSSQLSRSDIKEILTFNQHIG